VPCDEFKPNNTQITCAGTVFISNDDQAIVMAFRGTVGSAELAEELSKLSYYCEIAKIFFV
jgi:hypothetical protein